MVTSESSYLGHEEQLDELIAAYLDQLETDRTPQPDEWLDRHPEFKADLSRFFADRHELERLAAPLRAIAQPMVRADWPGKLGDYRIVREIGRGGMGIVYEAEQISLSRRVALKVLPFAAVLDAKQVQRFKNEAQAAANLDHPHIVSVYSVGCDRGVHYYAMQYVEGQSLAEVVEQLRGESGRGVEEQWSSGVEEQNSDYSTTPLLHSPSSAETVPIAAIPTLHTTNPRERFRQIARLGIQAAEALQYAHEMGIVHRDIKPSNLLVDAQSHVWVTDFGLATTQAGAGLTMTGDLLGTLRYMSPEQATGDRARTDYRSDIYSLGITLYELATCRPAFAVADRHILLHRIVEGALKPPRSIDAAVPRDLDTIIMTAAATEPADRYGSMHALADDLRRYLDSRPLHAKRHHRLQRMSRWLRRHHLATAVAAAVVIVIALIQAVALKRETRLRTEANAQRARAETNQQLAWDATFHALAPLTRWAQLPKSYALQRQALDELIATHRANTHQANNPNNIALLNFSRLLLLRADNSWQLGHDIREDCETAISILEPLRAAESPNDELRELLASAYAARGNYLQLDLRFQEAAGAYLDSARLANADAQHRGYDGAMFALNKSGKPTAAIKDGLVLVAMLRRTEASLGYPYSSVALREEAACSLFQLGRIDEAVHLIAEAIDISAQNKREDYVSQYWHARALMTGAAIANQSGNLQQGHERAKRAVQVFQKQHELAPDLVWITRKLGESYVYLSDSLVVMKQLSEAESALREAIRLNSSIGTKRDQYDVARMHFRLAQLLAASGEMDEASQAARASLEAFEEIAQALPDEPECISKLMVALTMSPDPTLRAANRAAVLAVRVLPDSSGLYWRLRALAQYRAGQWDSAIQSAHEAMSRLQGGDSIDRFILAMACWQSMKRDEARAWFAEAIERLEDKRPILYHDLGPLAVDKLKTEAESMIQANGDN